MSSRARIQTPEFGSEALLSKECPNVPNANIVKMENPCPNRLSDAPSNTHVGTANLATPGGNSERQAGKAPSTGWTQHAHSTL